MPNNDYILRSDALKAARYYKNRREENHVPSIDDVHLTEYQLLAQAINNIPAADVEPKREWIPVTERLPEKHEWVLVRSRLVKMRTDFVSNDGHWYATPAVTHWMPLPEPPKGENDDLD